jgi:hypothetical protein
MRDTPNAIAYETLWLIKKPLHDINVNYCPMKEVANDWNKQT